MSNKTKTANDLLRSARIEKGLSQLQMSLELDINYKTYQRWERGQTRPAPAYQGKLCRLLGKTHTELGFMEAELD